MVEDYCAIHAPQPIIFKNLRLRDYALNTVAIFWVLNHSSNSNEELKSVAIYDGATGRDSR